MSPRANALPVRDEEPMYQVLLFDDQPFVNEVHREALATTQTACGKPINMRMAEYRPRASYEGRLCPGCFTPHELKLSEQANNPAPRIPAPRIL